MKWVSKTFAKYSVCYVSLT